MNKKAVAAISLIACCSIALAGGEKSGKESKQKSKPSAEQIKALQTITLRIENRDGDLHFSWSPATSKDSGGVKIAYSTTNPEPLYPYDPYIAWLPGNNLSSHVARNVKSASKETRYYRICAVRPDNHKAYTALSNVVKVDPVNANEATKEYLQKKQEAKQHKPDTKKETVKESVSKQAKPDNAPKKASNDLTITCPKCGAKCSSEDNYCAKCGTML